MTKLHLDTDIGGDMDDLCALAMLLKWPNLEITGVTTMSEENGRRAGYVDYVLKCAGRTDIPCAAGADVSGGYYDHFTIGYPPDADNWPEPVTDQPGSPDKALALLKASIEQDATIVEIGPMTNLRLLDEQNPGILKQAKLFLMGGYVNPMPQGYPHWGNHDDYNIQVDVASAKYVLEHSHPTLIPLTVSVQTALRRAYLPRLANAGALGKLVAHQAEYFARTEHFEAKFGQTCPGLPPDIINFQHDPLACAIALGWHEGVEIETVPLKFELHDGWLTETRAPDGIPTRLVTKINGAAFNEFWLETLCRT